MGIVRAKFTCLSVVTQSFSGYESRTVTLSPQYDPNSPEDQSFSKATPSGKIEMDISNPKAALQFEPGKAYYVDFSPVDPA